MYYTHRRFVQSLVEIGNSGEEYKNVKNNLRRRPTTGTCTYSEELIVRDAKYMAGILPIRRRTKNNQSINHAKYVFFQIHM